MENAEATRTRSVHLDARREWNERYGDYIKQAANWRLAAIGALGVTAIAVAGLVYVSGKSHVVPYVVEVDKLGATLPIAPADQAAKVDSRIVRAQLANWISDIRSVYVDAAAENKSVRQAYALLDQRKAGAAFVNEYMQANDPFKRAQSEIVSVEVRSVLPIAGDSWRVEWDETVRSREGALKSTSSWQATIQTTIIPPNSEAALMVNPVGIYITAVSWSQRL